MTTSPSEPVDNPQPDPSPESDPDNASGSSDTADHEDTAPEYIDDSQLPEDLRPTDDNPLAQNEDESGTGSPG